MLLLLLLLLLEQKGLSRRGGEGHGTDQLSGELRQLRKDVIQLAANALQAFEVVGEVVLDLVARFQGV